MVRKLWRGSLLLCCGLLVLPALAQQRTVDTQAGKILMEQVADSLSHPWGLAFLPDRRMLVTERSGQLWLISPNGERSGPIGGVPEVQARGQGGLFDVALDPDFASNQRVYLVYAEPGEGGASTALGRGRLAGETLEDFEVLYSQKPKYTDGRHFGGRVVFTADKRYLFLTTGDRGQDEPAQDLESGLGKLIRLQLDGSVPQDNPFVNQAGALPEIWSYGHRNIQGADFHPETGQLWITEMGPRGGDELNLPEPGKNYGWPHVSWGRQYMGLPIPNPPTRPEFADAVHYWDPVISPSGITFYSGDLFPAWRNHLLISSLSRQGLVRVQLEGGKVVAEEVIALGARIRDVVQGPEGALYVLTDQPNGGLWRLTPQR